MKCIGTVLFIMGFYCRPVLALCFLLGFLFLKRARLFKKWKKCCWTNNTQCSWNPCSSYSNGQCSWNWGCCDETKESTTATTTPTTATATSSEKVSNLSDNKVDDDDNEFVNDSEDEKVEEKKSSRNYYQSYELAIKLKTTPRNGIY